MRIRVYRHRINRVIGWSCEIMINYNLWVELRGPQGLLIFAYKDEAVAAARTRIARKLAESYGRTPKPVDASDFQYGTLAQLSNLKVIK